MENQHTQEIYPRDGGISTPSGLYCATTDYKSALDTRGHIRAIGLGVHIMATLPNV
jgi:hypothetical protein